MDICPYSVVNNRGFRLVVRTIELCYKLPHRKHLAEKEVPHLYEKTKASVLEFMKKATGIALTCDAWTSVATKSFVTLMALFVLTSDKNGWKLVSHVLQTREMSESQSSTMLTFAHLTQQEDVGGQEGGQMSMSVTLLYFVVFTSLY